ncbi:hypothetical protein AGMMS49545_23200 [Betaproteobacteria bacterium]|nr:hypothetical protein AGMMS49545_23200 [Betaproteobacteria bacterium]
MELTRQYRGASYNPGVFHFYRANQVDACAFYLIKKHFAYNLDAQRKVAAQNGGAWKKFGRFVPEAHHHDSMRDVQQALQTIEVDWAKLRRSSTAVFAISIYDRDGNELPYGAHSIEGIPKSASEALAKGRIRPLTQNDWKQFSKDHKKVVTFMLARKADDDELTRVYAKYGDGKRELNQLKTQPPPPGEGNGGGGGKNRPDADQAAEAAPSKPEQNPPAAPVSDVAARMFGGDSRFARLAEAANAVSSTTGKAPPVLQEQGALPETLVACARNLPQEFLRQTQEKLQKRDETPKIE